LLYTRKSVGEYSRLKITEWKTSAELQLILILSIFAGKCRYNCLTLSSRMCCDYRVTNKGFRGSYELRHNI
jgi:hypothetical protein